MGTPTNIISLKVGTTEEWIAHNDHMPIILEFKIKHSAKAGHFDYISPVFMSILRYIN